MRYPWHKVREADDLWEDGQHDDAIRIWEALLALYPGDDAGIRSILLFRLLESGRDDHAADLLARYVDGWGADGEYGAALLAFRLEGDGATARRRLHDARESNPHVPGYILDPTTIPEGHEDEPFIDTGGPIEAAWIAAEIGPAWRATEGAVDWLARSRA